MNSFHDKFSLVDILHNGLRFFHHKLSVCLTDLSLYVNEFSMYTNDSHVALQGPVFGPVQFSLYVLYAIIRKPYTTTERTSLAVQALFFRYFPPENQHKKIIYI